MRRLQFHSWKKGSTHGGFLVRGPGLLHRGPAEPLLPTEPGCSIHWDRKKGFYCQIHRSQLEAEFNLPQRALLQIKFTNEGYKALGEARPLSGKELPMSGEEERDKDSESPLLPGGKGRAYSPINTEQEDPVTLATTKQRNQSTAACQDASTSKPTSQTLQYYRNKLPQASCKACLFLPACWYTGW